MEDPSGRNGFPNIKARPVNGPRPHRCEVCQRSFREVSTLRKHEQLHRADRPYVCTTCGKSFLWSSNLKVHERVHTGERPYKCKICHRCFTQSNDLRRHERNVHMRGKLYGYKNATSSRQNSHVNLAAYQAFAMQQRALLQQALTYETFMQNAAVASHAQMFGQQMAKPPPPPTVVSTSAASLPGRSLLLQQKHSPPRSPIKLEQVTPPSTPGADPERRTMLSTTSSPHTSDSLQSPLPSGYASSLGCATSVVQSPPLLMSPATNGSNYDNNNVAGAAAAKMMMMMSSSERSTPSSYVDEKTGYIGAVGRSSSSPQSQSHQHQHQQHHMSRIPSFEEFTRGIPSHHFPIAIHHRQHQQHDGEIQSETACVRITTSHENHHDVDNDDSEKYAVCDSVMDLSVRKTPPSAEEETDVDEAMEMKVSTMTTMPPPPPSSSRTPESETDSSKRAVTTTTSASPTADSGIHHCKHCNIFFYDYTMFHLHESLHSPYEDEFPFRCPSCAKNCQDRIEFMFHTVWHVKYPNTIPNYPSFRDSYLCT